MEKISPTERLLLTMFLGSIVSFSVMSILIALGAPATAEETSFWVFVATTNSLVVTIAYRCGFPLRQLDTALTRAENNIIRRLSGRR